MLNDDIEALETGVRRGISTCVTHSYAARKAKPAMKILIVDDHPVFREGIVALFKHTVVDGVVLQAASIPEALQVVSESPDLDVLLLDLMMPGTDGLPAIADFTAVRPDLPVVILSSSEDPKNVHRALALGALGYIPKSASPEALVSAIRLVLAGDLYIPSLILNDPNSGVVVESQSNARHGLTERQIEVLQLLAIGLPNKTIAAQLHLSEKTVKVHVTSILRSLNVANRTQAASVGRQAGLI